MKARARLIGSLAWVGLVAMVQAIEPRVFPTRIGVEGELQANQPMRVPLPAAVIQATEPGFSDLRLFDDESQETPYVIYTRVADSDDRSFTFELVSYAQEDDAEVLLLKRPTNIGAVHKLVLVTAAKDFKRPVTLEASDDATSWRKVTEDVLFDFSAHVALRRTTISFPPTSATWFRLRLAGAKGGNEGMGSLNLEYKDLKLDVQQLQTGAFKVTRVDGVSGDVHHTAAQYDHLLLTVDDMRLETDDSGDTVLAFGRLNLPVDKLTLQVDQAFFYRRVEVWAADQDVANDYTHRADGVLYRVPGMGKPQLTIEPHLGRLRCVKLIIRNADNPPLRVSGGELSWLRRELCFIPQAGRRYALYCGNPKAPSPRYETAQLIPYQAAELDRLPALVTGEVGKNTTFDAEASINTEEARSRQQQQLFTIGIAVVVVLLGGWMYVLMKSMRAQLKTEAENRPPEG